MRAATPFALPAHLTVLVSLAQCLEHVEQSGIPVDADQYLSLVKKLSEELGQVRQDEALGLVLNAFPASASIYENLQYQHAGLCRSPLEPALSAEMTTRNLLNKIRARH